MKEDFELEYKSDFPIKTTAIDTVRDSFYKLCDEDLMFNAYVDYSYHGLDSILSYHCNYEFPIHSFMVSDMFKNKSRLIVWFDGDDSFIIRCNLFKIFKSYTMISANIYESSYKISEFPEILSDWWKEVKLINNI